MRLRRKVIVNNWSERSDAGILRSEGRVSPMAITVATDLKRKGASPPVSAWNLRFLTGQLALFRLK